MLENFVRKAKIAETKKFILIIKEKIIIAKESWGENNLQIKTLALNICLNNSVVKFGIIPVKHEKDWVRIKYDEKKTKER